MSDYLKKKEEPGEGDALKDFDEALIASMSEPEKKSVDKKPKGERFDWVNEYLDTGELF